MDTSKYIATGQFLKAEDIIKNPSQHWEITGEGDFIESEKFKTLRLHLPLKSGEETRIFDCSKTNTKTITKFTNEVDSKKWIGKLIMFETYKTKTSEGKLVDAINIKEVK